MSERLLTVSGLTRAFGGLVAVREMAFHLDDGEILGLIGPNGSGKTTVLNLISGAIRPNAGAIEFTGQPIAGLPAYQISRRGIARTFQLVRVMPSLSVIENVLAGLSFHPRGSEWGPVARQRAEDLLAQVGLGGRADAVPGQLTYIDQKRLELARALALSPRVLLLDEWLAGLNPSELEQGVSLIKAIRSQGLAILLVEHVMHAIRSLCDRCVVMNAGQKIAEGKPDAVLSDREVMRSYLGRANA